MSKRVPILLNHDPRQLLGSLEDIPTNPERLRLRFCSPVTREQLFQIFPGAGIQVTEGVPAGPPMMWETISECEIIEFSLVQAPASSGSGEPIDDQEFNAIINGPLSHPLVPFAFTRLMLALRAVVDATGGAGADALRAVANSRQQQDEGGGAEG
jgi:hypothetical protein